MPKPKGATSYRFSAEAQDILARLAEALGVNKTSVLEMALRRMARAERLPAGPAPRSNHPSGEHRKGKAKT
jgi:hypothetical protein